MTNTIMSAKSRAAMEQIKSFWDLLPVKENKKIFEEPQDDYSILEVLADERFIRTSAKILREFFVEISGLNDPSDEELIHYLKTNHKSFVDGKRYKEPIWSKWITEGISSRGRRQAFTIAVNFNMKQEVFLKLLNSIDGETVHYRDPEDIIYYYAMRKGYSIEETEGLCQAYKNMIADIKEKGESIAEMKIGNTMTLRDYIDDSELLNELVSNYSQINEYSDNYSVTAAGRFVRLIQYLWMRYPNYFDIDSHKEEVEVSHFCHRSDDDEEDNLEISIFPDSNKLFNAFVGGCTVSSSPLKAKLSTATQKNITEAFQNKVCKASDAIQVFQDLRALFINLSQRIAQKYFILNGFIPCKETDHNDRHYAEVKRNEILLLTFFYFISYLYDDDYSNVSADELPKPQPSDPISENLTIIMSEGGIWDKFDKLMVKVQADIAEVIRYIKQGDEDSEEILNRYIDIFNAVLTHFGFQGIYLPNVIDRYFMICLMADEPEMVWDIDNLFVEK